METRKSNGIGKKYEKYAENRKSEGEDYNFYDKSLPFTIGNDEIRNEFGDVVGALQDGETVHDAWSIAMVQKDSMRFHMSMRPFDYLTSEVQYLNKPYVDKLNGVLDYSKGLKKLAEVFNAAK